MRLNLNSDLSEGWGPFEMGDDAALIEVVSTANIACGLHGGEPRIMREALRRARDRGVSVGAHPGYADLYGFGRRPMQLPAAEVESLILYQLGALAALARAEGMALTHVKPHGALNNQASADPALADTVARAVAGFDAGLILLAPVFSELALAGDRAGLRVALEVFADRAYSPDGQLAPRSQPGAVLHRPAESLAHVQRMIDGGGVVTIDGALLPTAFHSICVHGDGPLAVQTAVALRQALLEQSHELLPLPALMD